MFPLRLFYFGKWKNYFIAFGNDLIEIELNVFFVINYLNKFDEFRETLYDNKIHGLKSLKFYRPTESGLIMKKKY